MQYPGQESSQLEFKRELPRKEQILKTIIAFANQNGGKLVVGVEDNGTIVGVPEQTAFDIQQQLDQYIFEGSVPPLIPTIYSQRFGEKLIIAIDIASGSQKPYYLRQEGPVEGIYVRLGKHTHRAPAEWVDEMRWLARGRFFDSTPCFQASSADLNSPALEQFFSHRRKVPAIKPSKDTLLSYQILVQEQTASLPSVGGMLLFGTKPQRFFPEAFILCSHFKGTMGREVIASREVSGTLFEQLAGASEFILQTLHSSFSIQGMQRKEQLEIPEEAIREALINAIVHRSYAIHAPTKIALYRDRVEIFSPGCFPGPLNTHDLTEGLTYIRNTLICRAFFELGLIEKLGSGFITMFDSYRKRGLMPPQVIEGNNFIKVILPRQPLPRSEKAQLGEPILALFARSPQISIGDVIDNLGLSRSTAWRQLQKLLQAGLIEQVGKGRTTAYRLKTNPEK